MNPKNYLIIKESLFSDIEKYCQYNNINDIDEYINGLIEKSFLIEKYGDLNKISKATTVKNIPDRVENTNNIIKHTPSGIIKDQDNYSVYD